MDSTIIHGQSLGPTVTFQGDESSTCILSGFTITGGKSVKGGGIFGQGALATVSYNRITSNTTEAGTSEQGGGIYDCDGLIAHNVISENSSRAGGGIASCGGRIEDNIISGNTAILGGGGIFSCAAIISNNLIINNTAKQGGGLFDISTCRNNTIYGNKAQMWGGLFNFSGTIKNCIIWNNTAESYAQVNVSAKPGFCCIQDWTLWRSGEYSL